MKKYIILSISFCMMFIFQTYAQHGDAQHGDAQHGNAPKQLKGPAAKNTKTWKNSWPSSTLIVTQQDRPTGPEAKNQKSWKPSAQTQAVAFTEVQTLKGPKAKNTRPFERAEQDTVLIVLEK